MAKPRVIIADEDANYIVPLQFKFVTEFFEKIDLEIISSREYFEEHFSKPQNAEILIVSEELYDSSLQRHNISNFFVMSETQDEGQTGELNVNRLFKYSSVKEIFNEIIGKSAGALNIAITEKKETQIILVTSAAGGVGKTTVAMGIAASLARNYKRVLYINASRLQCFQYLLNNKTVITSPDVYMKLLSYSDYLYEDIKHVIRKEIFSYLPSFRASLLSVGIEFSIYEKIVLSAQKSGDFDFIVIDSEDTFDEDKNRLIDLANKVIIITEQTVASVQHTNYLAENINGINLDKYIFVCNKFDADRSNALIIQDISRKFTVTEYVENCEFANSIVAMSKSKGIQRVAFLLM